MAGVSVTQLYQELQAEHMRLQREHGAAEALLTKTQQDLEFVRNQIPVLESHAKALETQALRAELLEKQATRAEDELATARRQIPALAARAAKADILESQVARAEAELRLARQRNTILYVACGILGPTALALIVRWILLAAR